MESTKEQVLHLLQEHGSATVADLAEALGIGQVAVRRHLDHLRMDGLADVRAERHGVGRPAFVFYPTEEAEERLPAGYSRLLSRLYQGLHALDEAQVRGRDGVGLLHTAFEAAAEQVAGTHRSAVRAESLEGRVAQATEALEHEGIVDEWSHQDEGYRLRNSACPYRKAALLSDGPCELDRRTIELLVRAPVQQVKRIADGHSQCEYIVAAIQGKEPDGRLTASETEKLSG